ncbi:MAG: hypothetical protein A2431_02685 [Candidatus Zambryskibacteria bacterium RIFOXYC1_FULL_39_10]|uniref:Uncharacterized protein n=1 Tax=Candidatus Zambryskibacteria bacterium RIFOXYC1_FULL_39_10 TaxID=1802779 RepID=A0A1G2UXX0_9BACT|nr:MAG: hypothetical protein A2431_02685 [Candidatus Zambryskibacteria bacterium RIFOXYC1_FULL_39_10]OHB14786.1 MAG: hypothetical protein A2605_03985 [Candidatus Zambryskibacteria bacterium RIFOXYD1_FULL_39_35]
MPVQTPIPPAHPSVREEETLQLPIQLDKLTPEAAKRIYSQIRGLSGPTRQEIERLAGVVQK